MAGYDASGVLVAREPMCLRPVRAQAVGDRHGWKTSQLAQALDAELGELPLAVGGEREKREWQGLQEEPALVVVYDHYPARGSDARCCERGEAARGCSDPRLPGWTDGIEGAAQALLQSTR